MSPRIDVRTHLSSRRHCWSEALVESRPEGGESNQEQRDICTEEHLEYPVARLSVALHARHAHGDDLVCEVVELLAVDAVCPALRVLYVICCRRWTSGAVSQRDGSGTLVVYLEPAMARLDHAGVVKSSPVPLV